MLAEIHGRKENLERTSGSLGSESRCLVADGTWRRRRTPHLSWSGWTPVHSGLVVRGNMDLPIDREAGKYRKSDPSRCGYGRGAPFAGWRHYFCPSAPGSPPGRRELMTDAGVAGRRSGRHPAWVSSTGPSGCCTPVRRVSGSDSATERVFSSAGTSSAAVRSGWKLPGVNAPWAKGRRALIRLGVDGDMQLEWP